MQTETLDKMYLEWSQYTQARTFREKRMETALGHCIARLQAIGESNPELTSEQTISEARYALGPPVLE